MMIKWWHKFYTGNKIDKIKLPPNYLKRKETFAASYLIHGLTEQRHDVNKFCDNPMGDSEKL